MTKIIFSGFIKLRRFSHIALHSIASFGSRQCGNLFKLSALGLFSAGILVAGSCGNDFCSQAREFSVKVNYSNEAIDLNLHNLVSALLGHSITVTFATANCPNWAFDGDNLTFRPLHDCAIKVAGIRHMGRKSPDTNDDRIVDDADLLAVLFAFGSTGCGLPPDVNEDGVVDDADLLLVLFCFGTDGESCRAQKNEKCDITIYIDVVNQESTGQTGSQGSQGEQGSQGQNMGSSGEVSGTTNEQGSSGASGSNGSGESNGSNGASGATGSQSGSTGEGSTGSQGAAGAQGQTGNSGTAGSQTGESDITCEEIPFRANIRTMDSNTRTIRRAVNAVLVYIGKTVPARRHRSLQANIFKAQTRVNNLFVANWTLMWQNLPSTLVQCSSKSQNVVCTSVNFNPIYNTILANEMRMIQIAQSLISKFSPLFRNRPGELVAINKKLKAAKRLARNSASFVESLPVEARVCS